MNCRGQVLVGALDAVSNTTANLLENVKEAQKGNHVLIYSNDRHKSSVEYESELELIPNLYNGPYVLLAIAKIKVWSSWTLPAMYLFAMCRKEISL